MVWHHYVASFFSGVFLANFVPHFVQGISGDRFPTPFAKPRGKGLSSSTVNVIWALFNLIVGYLLFREGRLASGEYVLLLAFLAGVAAISLGLSVRFRHKESR